MADKPRRLPLWKPRYWRTVRGAVQALALGLFLYLFLRTVRGGVPPEAAGLFLRLDPLAMAAALLSSKTLFAGAGLALITLALTAAAGRAWCGWLCPLGTTLDLFHPRRWKNQQPSIPDSLRAVKHFLLIAILCSALLGSLWLMFLDPVTIMIRSLTGAVYPAFDRVVLAAETALYAIPALRGPVSSLDTILRPALLPADPAFTAGGLLTAGLLVGIIALNWIAPRFWCRYLCPLGSLLGLVSKIAIFRRKTDPSACTNCGACAKICPTGTIDPERDGASDPAECTVCLECVALCPRAGQSFPAHTGPAPRNAYDPGRRQFFAAVGAAIGGVALLKTDQYVRRDLPHLIRPPGAAENDLLAKCIRCGECVRICPTGALHPSVAEAGVEGFWTPVLLARAGYCLYSCNACGQVCPVGAIPNLPLKEKQSRVMGAAYVDRDRCIAWSDHEECLVCEEMCPLPEKAIRVDYSEFAGGAPVVDRTLCIGCGNCEYKCPVNGEAAIRVYAPGRDSV
ncbi:MAG: 4Fe-4S binding protein [Anaerolineales bacterium]|nr:4Fe-4S binding protein [Anaerolineales bacterium]